MTPWVARLAFPVVHPRQALCDSGVWKCPTHPRMLWLASERRWAIRHRLRARRVARLSGWAPGELAGHIERERALLLARLAHDLDVVRARHWVSRDERGWAPAITLHTHDEATPCRGRDTGCSTYPATETVTTFFPRVMDTIGLLEAERRWSW